MRYEFVRREPYVRKSDGGETTLNVWLRTCAVCGEGFEVKTPGGDGSGKRPDQPKMRKMPTTCLKHRGRVRKPQPEPKNEPNGGVQRRVIEAIGWRVEADGWAEMAGVIKDAVAMESLPAGVEPSSAKDRRKEKVMRAIQNLNATNWVMVEGSKVRVK